MARAHLLLLLLSTLLVQQSLARPVEPTEVTITTDELGDLSKGGMSSSDAIDKRNVGEDVNVPTADLLGDLSNGGMSVRDTGVTDIVVRETAMEATTHPPDENPILISRRRV